MKFIEKAIRQNAGMTLVEMVIAALIFSVVLAVLTSVFFSSNDVYRQTNQRINIQECRV